MTRTPEDHVQTYLRRLNHELRGLPRAARREVLEEVSGHIEEARAEGSVETESDVRNLLDRLGSPDEIAADARERFGVRLRGGGIQEIAAIVLLLFGGFIFAIGWLVGLILLWASEAWTLRDKLIGTFLVPFGLLPALWLATGSLMAVSESCITRGNANGTTRTTCEGGATAADTALAVLLFLVVVVGPFFTTVYLALRMRRPPPAPATIATPTVT